MTSGSLFHGLNALKMGVMSFQCQMRTWVKTAPRERLEVMRYRAFVAENQAGCSGVSFVFHEEKNIARTPSVSYLAGSKRPSVNSALWLY